MFGIRLRILRENAGYSMDKLIELYNARYSAKMNKSTLSRYERGLQDPIYTVVVNLANFFNVSVDYLLGSEEPSKSAVKIPVLGTVVAGIPLEAIEEILDWEEISESMARQGDFFGLVIRGDSMAPRFLEGDVVIVRQQHTADSGDIVIAKVNGDDACCKKLIKHDEGISLVSLNSTYAPMYFGKNEILQKPVTIIGKVVELRGKM